MAIWNLFSKREADAAKSGKEDVYQYSLIPNALRVQLAQISVEAIGKVGIISRSYGTTDVNNPRWQKIESTFCRERGVHAIEQGDFSGERITKFMTSCQTSDWLDLAELIYVAIERTGMDDQYYYRDEWQVVSEASEAIEEINYRFRQANVGYQFEEGKIVRVDSQFLHAEVVKPALAILAGSDYAGPREEFLAAHQHYRRGEHRQAVAMAANSLESTFKSIFDQKGWKYEKTGRISDLLKVARANNLWPKYLDNSFDQLVATLQSGLPKIRDNDASHGQGSVPRDVPPFVAAYALHLAASKIKFITDAAA